MKRTFMTLFRTPLLLVAVSIFSSCVDEIDINSDDSVLMTRGVINNTSSSYYKVVPGSEEWASLNSIDERWATSQINPSLLDELTTEELAQACWEFPLGPYFIFYDDERDYISSAFVKFNGLKELATRKNCVSAILDVYDSINWTEEPIGPDVLLSSLDLSLNYWELILADANIVNQMTIEDIELAKRLTWDKLEMKIAHPEYFGTLSLKRSLMLLSVLSTKNRNEYSEKELKILEMFSRKYYLFDSSSIEVISKILLKK